MGALARLRDLVGFGASPAPLRPQAAYFKGERDSLMFSWRPALRNAGVDVRASRILGAARAIESLQNSGWLAGGVEKAVAMTVGPELRLNAKPDGAALGWDKKATRDWARLVERRWEAWASNPSECDAAGKHTLGQLTASAFRAWFGHGEQLAVLKWLKRPEATTRTKLALLDPAQLRAGLQFDARDGIAVDPDGRPIAYTIMQVDQSTWLETPVVVPARTPWGRPITVHVFDGLPGQLRGITPFAPVLKVCKQYDQLADGTLTTTLLQTIFAATVKSAGRTADAMQGLLDPFKEDAALERYLSSKTEWYDNSRIDLGMSGRIAHLFPGEELEFHGAKHPSSNYKDFSKGLLREVASCLGITYEMLTGDYTGATYSSVRMASAEAWLICLFRRKLIASRIPQATYEAWLEEEVAAGRIPFPGGFDAFLANRAAVVRAAWRGPARPQADDMKAAEAQVLKLKANLTTLEAECAELGEDWEDVAEQRAEESEFYASLGLADPHASIEQLQLEEAKADPAEEKPQGAGDGND